jgi:hypothetical protein
MRKIVEGLLLTTLTVTVMFCLVGFKYEIAGDKYNAYYEQKQIPGTLNYELIAHNTDFC